MFTLRILINIHQELCHGHFLCTHERTYIHNVQDYSEYDKAKELIESKITPSSEGL